MAGFQTHDPNTSPRGGFLRSAFVIAVAAVGALALMRACSEDEKKMVAPPIAAPEPEAEPQRVPYFFALATSHGSTGYAGAGTRADAEKEALEICTHHRNERMNKHVYVGAEECEIVEVASNYSGPGCIVMSLNNETYRAPNIITGSAIDIKDRVRTFLHSEFGTLYNERINPQAETTFLCVDYYGRPSIEKPGFTLSR